MNPTDDYERSADLRLLDHARRSLGISSHTSSPWRHASGTHIDLLAEDEEVARPAGPLINVHFVAQPASGLITGARVTLAIAIENEGAGDARAVMVRIGYGRGCLPLETQGRLDETDLTTQDAEGLFGAGLPLGDLRGGERRTIVALLVIEAGLDPIVVEATVQASSAPVIAAAPVSLLRGKLAASVQAAAPSPASPRPPATTPAPELPPVSAPLAPSAAGESPFYELEPEEAMVFEATDAALSTAAPTIVVPVAPASVAPVVIAPVAPPEPTAEPPAPARATDLPDATQTVPAGEGATNSAASLILVRRIDRARLSAVAGMFASSGVGMLAHFLLANLIAAGHSPDESDPFGLARFIDEQTTVLNRLWVAKRLRKPMEVGESTVTVEPLAPVLRYRVGAPGVLVTRIQAPERDFVNAAIARGTVPFLRARQITLLLQPTGVVEDGEIVPVPALVEYAKRAQSLMTKYALRAATKTPDEALATVDPVLDGYAKEVLTYLDTIAR